jgi:lipoyl(octanoyl) transferase
MTIGVAPRAGGPAGTIVEARSTAGLRRSGTLLMLDGLTPYRVAFELMHSVADERLRGEVPDTLILCEHPPVYTAGRRFKPEHVVWTEAQIQSAGAELHLIDRGGSVTFHGPGQLVGYPISDLGVRPDVQRYVHDLEEVVIGASADAGVGGLGRNPVNAGVWAEDRKVCAIGVRVARMRVTLHGFALNCSTDLSWFDAIVPCGLTDTSVTSLSALAGREVTVEEMTPLVERRFERVFGIDLASD